jgi:hypothetical protein
MGINEVMAMMALVTTIHWMRCREARAWRTSPQPLGFYGAYGRPVRWRKYHPVNLPSSSPAPADPLAGPAPLRTVAPC